MEKKIIGWVAKNKNGVAYFYEHKPEKGFVLWGSREQPILAGVHENIFSQIKWEDEEPTKVELTIKICE